MTFKLFTNSFCEVSWACLTFLVRLSVPLGLAGFSERRGTNTPLFSLLPRALRNLVSPLLPRVVECVIMGGTWALEPDKHGFQSSLYHFLLYSTGQVTMSL